MHSSSTHKWTTETEELFFSLIRCSIGKEAKLPVTPTPEQWQELLKLSNEHTLTGITFVGIQKLPKEQRPQTNVLLQWYTICEKIKSINSELNKKCVIVSQKFKQEGFNNCILKGQGIARLYPSPELRTPGDIDIWLSGGEKKIIDYVKRFIPDSCPTYHHVDFPIAKGYEIEIHYRPSWMYNPIINKRLQKFFTRTSDEQFTNSIQTPEGEFNTPTPAFNRIYILLHIYRHLFFEGIGLRQMLDYYFLLHQEITEEERNTYIKQLKQFGIYKFAGAATYAMQQIFGLDEQHTIIPPNERHGKFLIREIMEAGNFGKYDRRYDLTRHGYSVKRAYETARRNLTLITRYPVETLWSPYFKIMHYIWRKRNSR